MITYQSLTTNQSIELYQGTPFSTKPEHSRPGTTAMNNYLQFVALLRDICLSLAM